jgi:hypothetical protein
LIGRSVKDSRAPETVSDWTERYFISSDLRGRVDRIGIGIHAPASKVGPLAVAGGATDWDGHRALIALPKTP